MRGLQSSRRSLLRLIALGIVVGWGWRKAGAQPMGKRLARVVRQPTVVIDPGHGGIDPGAISPSGAYEKDIVLATAWEFARQLAATRRYRVVLTRSIDEFITLHDRVARARAWRADLFLSIHADALPETRLRGLSVFTLSTQASDNQATLLGTTANRDGPARRINLTRRGVGEVLIDLTRRQTVNLSLTLARDILDQLSREVVLLDHPQRSADFAVLTALDIPSALIELGCVSNPREERELQQPAYQQKLARGLVRGVQAYFGDLANPARPPLAAPKTARNAGGRDGAGRALARGPKQLNSM